MSIGIGFGSGGFTGGPEDPETGGPPRHRPLDPLNPHSRTSKEAYWRGVLGDQWERYRQLRSAALPELMGERTPGAFGGMAFDISPALARHLIRTARQGALTPDEFSTYNITKQPQIDALMQLQSDYGDVRAARAGLAEARGTEGFRPARQEFQDARQLARTRERMGLTSAEYADRLNRRRLTQGLTPEERMDVFRRAGVNLGDAETAAMYRNQMTPSQAFMSSKRR